MMDPRLQILEDGVSIRRCGTRPCPGRAALRWPVVAGVAHQGVVIAWHALSHHERAARHLRVQVLGRLQDGLGRHRAEMVRGQRSKEAIHPHLRGMER